jgi:hypothetical protein
MAMMLTKVKDIGPVAAATLAKHGINSVEALASLSPAQLGEVPGFGSLRSGRVIAAAKSLLATAESAGIGPVEKAATLKPRTREQGAEQKGKSKGGGKKGKGKSRSSAGDAGKKPGKGKGRKSRKKGDKKKSAAKKEAKKRDKKKKGKKKK